MRKLPIPSGLAALAMLASAPAAAEPGRCTITRIKDKDVSIDVPITERTGPEAFCKTRAQTLAKQYAIDHPICSASNARESTFSVTVVWRADNTDKTFEVRAYCPRLPARKPS